MSDVETIATAAVYRGPRVRRRIEAKPDTAFAGFWFEVDENNLTNGDVEALRRNTYWVDVLDLMARRIIAWNYVAEVLEATDEPAVLDEAGKEQAPARQVWHVAGEEVIPPPAEGGVESLRRVIAIEGARGVKADDGTVGWMLARLRGYRDDLSEQVAKALALLANSSSGEQGENAPGADARPSPTRSRASTAKAAGSSPPPSPSPT